MLWDWRGEWVLPGWRGLLYVIRWVMVFLGWGYSVFVNTHIIYV